MSDRLFDCVPAALATAAVLLVLATGMLWAVFDVAQECDSAGRFKALGATYECRAVAR